MCPCQFTVLLHFLNANSSPRTRDIFVYWRGGNVLERAKLWASTTLRLYTKLFLCLFSFLSPATWPNLPQVPCPCGCISVATSFSILTQTSNRTSFVLRLRPSLRAVLVVVVDGMNLICLMQTAVSTWLCACIRVRSQYLRSFLWMLSRIKLSAVPLRCVGRSHSYFENLTPKHQPSC